MKHLYIGAIALALVAQTTTAQTTWRTERLQRHVIAVPQSSSGSNYLVSWRMLDTDDDYTTFDVIKNGTTVASHINNATCYLDAKGSKTSEYRIVTRRHGEPVDTTKAITPWQSVFMQLTLDRPESGTFHDITYAYTPNDCSVADVDGDGEYEILVKWESVVADNAQGGFTGPTIFDCYKFDGTKLWRIDMGHNIRSGPHYVPFLFYDFDGNGKAELIVKTGPGTTDGAGNYVTEAATDEDIKATDNEREYLNIGGQVLYGPEFLTVFDGLTGEAIHTIYYNPNRGCFEGGAPELRSDIWGDDYANRSERYLATVAYLDGPQGAASAVMCRGYYTRSYLWAVDFDGTTLSTRWRHASLSGKVAMTTDSKGNKDVRTYNRAIYPTASLFTAYGQGNHNLTVSDVDNDGYDEIIYGSAAIDDDGTLLWALGLGHGDAIHMGDLMPDRPGLEVFGIHEHSPFGMHICDAATGELLVHMTGEGDCARGVAADVDAKRGYEFWFHGGGYVYNIDGSTITGDQQKNFRIYWDGDVYDELLNDIGNHNQPYLEKVNKGRIVIDGKQVYEHGYNTSCNGTKGSPCLVADIFGDWREEMIFYNNDDKSTLNIFSTSTASSARVPSLMYDHTYRLAIAWQNVGYNQPPHLGYYLPDSVAPRLDYHDTSLKEQSFTLGDTMKPVTMHYVNCTGISVSEVVYPNGHSSTTVPTGISIVKDAVNCTATLQGTLSQVGNWELVIRTINSSNGLPIADTLRVEVKDVTSTEPILHDNTNNATHDLLGRKLQTAEGLNPVVYIIRGQKVIVNK